MRDFETAKIWFIRHAESEANVQRIYANGGCSFPLTANSWIFSEQDSCVGLSHGHLASGGAVNFSGDVASLIAGQENENGGDLSGLGSTPEDCL
jgi:hypothetical protein